MPEKGTKTELEAVDAYVGGRTVLGTEALDDYAIASPDVMFDRLVAAGYRPVGSLDERDIRKLGKACGVDLPPRAKRETLARALVAAVLDKG